MKTKMLKQYLAWFNGATVQVNDPNQKFFVKAFQKGLQECPFSDSLAFQHDRDSSPVKKHVEVEEDKEDRLQAKRVVPTIGKKNALWSQAHPYRHESRVEKYTPIAVSRVHILKEVYHLPITRSEVSGASFIGLMATQRRSVEC
ncbi:hypothetical protein CR513_53585, partial [Mucuna pruriens]